MGPARNEEIESMTGTTINHMYRGVTIEETHWETGEVTFLALVLGGIEAADVESAKAIIDDHHTRFPEHEVDDHGEYVLKIERDMFGLPLR